MKKEKTTRREFIKTGAYLTLSGLGVSLFSSGAGAADKAAKIDPDLETLKWAREAGLTNVHARGFPL